MNKPSLPVLIGGGLVVLLLGAIAFASGGAGSKSESAVRKDPSTVTSTAMVTSGEAQAWAEARAADSASAYRVYLAAYPTGAFSDEARAAIGGQAQERSEAQPVRTEVAAAPPRRSRSSIAAACRNYVDDTLPAPSKMGRTVGGAAGGCAVGLLAGGDDGRNCAIGAVAGGATGAITAERREKRRRQEVQYCISNGGPPG